MRDSRDSQPKSTRRALIRRGAGLIAGAALSATILGGTAEAAYRSFPRPRARAFPLRRRSDVRQIGFEHMHTGEDLSIVYSIDGEYQPGALAEINHLLRDFHTGEIKPIDPKLLDLLFALRRKLGTSQPFHVASAYRSPQTNAMLAETSSAVAVNSLHMEGMAIDIRVPHRPLASVRDAALALKGGGVGYYPRGNYLHLDTGRIRRW